MEAAATPTPRNLTVPLAAWLRRLGFTVLEQGGVRPTALGATWVDAQGVFSFIYVYSATGATAHLEHFHDNGYTHTLVALHQVRRLREARFLLLNNVAYDQARQAALAAGTLQPA